MSDPFLLPTSETCEQTPGRHVWVTACIPPLPWALCECGKWEYGCYCESIRPATGKESAK